ncbi:C1q-related factor [Kryptolebias marmoratus]|uniref:C1q-related factor n=1 Tax=Kryptolebias marmoratus TaxID=37003 RepID=UPI0007F88778|nr:C1q-related factor [Kryptolebias marmoratus]
MKAVALLGLLHAAAATLNFKFSWNGPHAEPDSDPNADSACSWDQPSCGCCLMVREMDRLRTYFNTTLTELQEEFAETNQSLQSIQDSRVAFTVSLYNNNSLTCDGPFSEDCIVTYRHAFLNLGEAYSTNTGIFTVPHSGVYSLAVTAFGSSGNTLAVCTALQVNGQTRAAAKEFKTKDKEDSATIAIALHLQAGDKVSVNLAKDCFICDDDNHHNTFSAFLLYAAE